MSQDAIAKLDGLIAALENELASDPRVKLLEDLKRARNSYVGDENSELSPSSRIPAPVAEGRQMTPARAKAYELVKAHLTGKSAPVKTRALYEMIEEAGVDLPGGINNLHALLGRFPKVFLSHGRPGWTLKESETAISKTQEAAGDLLSRSAPTASYSSPPDQRTNLQ